MTVEHSLAHPGEYTIHIHDQEYEKPWLDQNWLADLGSLLTIEDYEVRRKSVPPKYRENIQFFIVRFHPILESLEPYVWPIDLVTKPPYYKEESLLVEGGRHGYMHGYSYFDAFNIYAAMINRTGPYEMLWYMLYDIDPALAERFYNKGRFFYDQAELDEYEDRYARDYKGRQWRWEHPYAYFVKRKGQLYIYMDDYKTHSIVSLYERERYSDDPKVREILLNNASYMYGIWVAIGEGLVGPYVERLRVYNTTIMRCSLHARVYGEEIKITRRPVDFGYAIVGVKYTE